MRVEFLKQNKLEMINMKKFSLEAVKNRRIELKMSIATVAKLMGFKNYSVYWKYENGKLKFDVDKLARLAEIFQCEPDIFFVE